MSSRISRRPRASAHGVGLSESWAHGSTSIYTTTDASPSIEARPLLRTLERFRRVITSRTSAPGPTAAWLGEVVVHAQDIRRPLGLSYIPAVETVTEIARFYARRDFSVASRSTIKGLRVEATDGPFSTGDGPLGHVR